ncbi:MAG: HEAT repeat domain-containing protein [Anaerolineae bacterium]|nr:HEAT repeat domain-containing protein [Anaerolineae bacterium]
MLEILVLWALTKRIGSIVEQKGRKSGRYKVLTVVLWLGGEIIGAIVGAIMAGADESARYLIYIVALGGAAVGAGISYLIAENLAPVSRDKHTVVLTTSFPSQAAAEEVLHTSPDSHARLDAAIALGMTNSVQVVPALAKALLSDKSKYVRADCAGYLGSIKGDKAEEALLQAMGDPDPYVRKKVVEALFRLGTEEARKAIENALKDADPEVRAEAERYASKAVKRIQKRLCPFLSEFGMCEPPGVSDLHECFWETQGRGYIDCFVYKMHTHPGGPGDFLRRNL